MELYGDGIGYINYVDHMGTDLTIVNSARVSFGKRKEELDERDTKLINYLVRNVTLMLILGSTNLKCLERSISQTDKQATPKS